MSVRASVVALACCGLVVVSATQITAKENDLAYIRILLHIGTTGVSFVRQVPINTTLGNYFSVSLKEGDYSLNTPLQIGQVDGEPIMLTVGNQTEGP